MRSFGLPFKKDLLGLNPNRELHIGKGITTVPTYYDSNDECAFAIVGRSITIIRGIREREREQIKGTK